MNNTYDHIIYFISFKEDKNKLDEIERVPVRKPVYADIPELSFSDRTQAQADGLKADKKFVTAESLEYEGERFIEYSGEYYKIIRSEGTKNGRGLVFICESSVNPWESDSSANAEVSNEI